MAVTNIAKIIPIIPPTENPELCSTLANVNSSDGTSDVSMFDVWSSVESVAVYSLELVDVESPSVLVVEVPLDIVDVSSVVSDV